MMPAVRRARDHVGRVLGHQPIARLALAQRLLGHAPLGDVVVHADRSDHVAGRVDDRRAADLQPDHRAVLAAHANLVLIGDVAHAQPRLLAHHRDVFGIGEQQVALQADQLFARVADHLAEAVVDELQHAVVAGLHEPFAHPLDEQPVTLLAFAQRVLGELAVGDVDDRSFEDLGIAIEQMDAFDQPAGTAVFAPQRDLVAGHHPFAAQLVDELVAMRRILIKLRGGLLHQLLARGEAEDAGHGVVALEDAAVDGVAINAGEIALEQKAMPLLAAAQRGLGAMTLDGVDENLAADAQQRHRLVAPRVRYGARPRRARRESRGCRPSARPRWSDCRRA